MKIDIPDLGEEGRGHLDVNRRARASALSNRVILATSLVHLVIALPFAFLGLVDLVRSKYLPAGVHSSERAVVPGKYLDSFRTGIVRDTADGQPLCSA